MDRSRSALVRSAPPLWLLGVCLFLPTVRACERMESPAHLASGGPGLMALLSPYFVAELLCVVVVVALAAGVSRRLLVAARVLVAVAAASPLAFAFMGACEHRLADEMFGAGGAVAFTAGAIVLARARRRDACDRLAALVAAFTLFALPLAVELALIGAHAPRDLGPGGWLTIVALAALGAIHVPRAITRG